MELMVVLLKQLAIMFILMGVGLCLFKSGKITMQGNKELGSVLLYVILPCAIVNSYMSVEYSIGKVCGLLWSFRAAALSLGLAILVSRASFGNRHKIEHFGTAFSNAGFMGIPIVQAVVGTEAVFYVAAYVALLNILQWTYGVVVMSGSKEAVSVKRLVTNPVILSMAAGVFLFLVHAPVPAVIRSAVAYLAGMNAPVAMVVMGVYLAQMHVKELFAEKYAYISAGVRLVGIPLLTIAALGIIPARYQDIRLATLMAASAPVGSNVAIFAEINGLDYARAVKGVCLSTIFSIFTMPVIVGLAGMIWR